MARLAATGPNEAQIEFWNSPVGDKWVALQENQDRMLAPLGEAAMAAADIAPGHRVIDIGCGSGTTSLELAARVGAAGYVLGIDISTPMLEHARQRAAAQTDLAVSFENRDAASAGSRSDGSRHRPQYAEGERGATQGNGGATEAGPRDQ